MRTSRRDFLRTTALAAPAVGFSAAGLLDSKARATTQQSRNADGKTMLILGGTGFLGPHVVHAALEMGYEVTLFNRGRTNPHLFPDLEKLEGDRNEGQLDALKGRNWDVVIDTWSFGPNVVEDAARLLKDHVDHYTFISTISVYKDKSRPGMDETGELDTIPEDESDMYQWKYYGPLQALCEQAAEQAMPGRTLSIRPGLIVGPRDRTDRFTYWPVRVERGGAVLAPGAHSDPVQYIDVRDLAEFIMNATDARMTGPCNATGPNGGTTIGQLLCGCKAVTGGDASFTWVDHEFLAEHGVQPWQHMPVWVPPVGEYRGFGQIDCSKAVEAGLQTRPLADTVDATLKWWHDQPEQHRVALAPDTPWGPPAEEGQSPRRAGVTAAREQEVLAAWHARSG